MAKLLKEGDVIELKPRHRVYADVEERFVYENTPKSRNLTHTDVEIGGERDQTNLAGRYIVIKTNHEGGGTGMGPHDVYPDGHHVFCQKVDDPTVRVDFYQTGSFTAMIPEIKPVGKATCKWTVKKG
jgi:hypothetical protein